MTAGGLVADVTDPLDARWLRGRLHGADLSWTFLGFANLSKANLRQVCTALEQKTETDRNRRLP